MQKQLLNELQVLAKKIASFDHTTNIAALKNEAQSIYEKLSVLDFVSQNMQISKVEDTKQEVLQPEIKPQKVVVETPIQEIVEPKIEVTKPVQEVVEQEVAKPIQEVSETPLQKPALVEEKKPGEDINNYLSNDDVDTIFDQNQWEIKDPAQRSLNRKLKPETITVGLNDRIGFVNHLFNFSQADFNRVLSQLNTIDNEQAAYDFINKMVKPEYDWTGKEEYEQRLFDLIARRFS